jgi:hypothetical protein
LSRRNTIIDNSTQETEAQVQAVEQKFSYRNPLDFFDGELPCSKATSHLCGYDTKVRREV